MALIPLHSSKQLKLFETPWLDRLSMVHPLAPLSFWLFVISLLLSRSTLSPAQVALTATMGFLIWTPTEYILHRWVFHFNATTPLQKRILFMIHGIHHDDPNDQRRILMPILPAVLFSLPFWFGFHALMGAQMAPVFFSGFILGYLLYDYTHFAVHYFRPKSGIFYRLKDHHMKHHFVDHDAAFGVSSTLWDHVFGTLPRTKSQRVSAGT